MIRKNTAFRVAILGLVICLTSTFVAGQNKRASRWTKISSSRDGKSLRNTFPFNAAASHGHGEHHHDHHEHHHESDTSSARRQPSPRSSLPRLSFKPPAIDSRGSRQRGTGGVGGDDISLDIGSIAAAGERCIDKVIMVQETEYDDVITCKHSYSEKCHTTYSTDYTPQQEEKCEENFKKNCFIEFKPKASQEQVKFCYTPLVKNCDIPGPEECSVEYTSACTTRYHEHDVEDDVVDCFEELETKCEDVTQGYTTSEKCTKWPVQKCGKLQKATTKKYSPETECKKVPFELCGPGACPLEQGEEECQDRTQTAVQEVPEETCNLEPQRICKHVTKLVPHLKATENCIDIPKEVCTRSRTNPRTVNKPIVKKWCYTPSGQAPPRPPPRRTTRRPPPPPPRRTTTQPPPRPTRADETGGDSKQGTQRTPTQKPKGPSIRERKRKCRRASPVCDTSQIREDRNNPGQADQDLLCKARGCQVKECGWLGGTCEVETVPPPKTYLPPPTTPKSTYLPPHKGY